MQPEQPEESADFLPLTATPEEEEARRETLDGKRKLATENIRIRLRAKKAEARIAELEAKLADEAVNPELRHRDAVRGALDSFDFIARGARPKAVAELLVMTKLDDSGALVLVDDESGETVPLDEGSLRELLAELVNSHTGGGAGAGQPAEAVLPQRGARDEDANLIEKGRRSQSFYEENRAAILAAEKRRTR